MTRIYSVHNCKLHKMRSKEYTKEQTDWVKFHNDFYTAVLFSGDT